MATIQTFTAFQVLTAAQLNTLQGYVGVVQVKSTTKTDTFTTTSGSFTDITGLSVSITPTSASNKILIIANVNIGGNPTVSNANLRFMRDSTAIGLGDAAGSRTRATANTTSPTDATSNASGMSFLDSPATTSATTYKIQMSSNASSTIAVNRTLNDSDIAGQTRSVSTITVMEVTP